MPNTNNKNAFSRVMERIRSGHLKPRGRWYFALRAALYALIVMLVAAAVIFVIGWIRLSLHRNGIWFLPGFGAWGWRMFIGSFPWLTVAVVAVLIIALEALLRHYGVVYKRPLLYSAGLVVCVLIVVGVLLDVRQFNAPVRGFAGVPGMEFHRSRGPAIVGQVMDLSDNHIIVRDMFGRMLFITDKRMLPSPLPNISVGDTVVVGGFVEDSSGTLRAFGIRPIDRDDLYIPPQFMVFPEPFEATGTP